MSKLQGISPQLPLVYDKTDGPYRLNKNLKEAIKQNFKMLLLTSPGERIMEPEFGVGLHNYLFENINETTFASIVQRIQSQTATYISAINLEDISFITSDEDSSLHSNEVHISIKYNILPYDGQDELRITSTMTT